MDATHEDLNQVEGIVDHWGDLMATCYAHLQSALSAIEELSKLPEGSPIDAYCYHQASGCVWVALVALAQCGSDAPVPGWGSADAESVCRQARSGEVQRGFVVIEVEQMTTIIFIDESIITDVGNRATVSTNVIPRSSDWVIIPGEEHAHLQYHVVQVCFDFTVKPLEVRVILDFSRVRN
jgi:hypothetical protein